MPPPRKAPKPRWKELVAPYDGTQAGPTIRDHIRWSPAWVWTYREGCGCTKVLPLYPCIVKYGLDIPMQELRLKLKCGSCGGHPSSFSCPTFGRNDEYRFPPIDRVPESMRGFAMIDPLHLPAPLRG